MRIIDHNKFKSFALNEKISVNNLMNNINSQIDGRVCVSDWLYSRSIVIHLYGSRQHR